MATASRHRCNTGIARVLAGGGSLQVVAKAIFKRPQTSMMKDIEIRLDTTEFSPNVEFAGNVKVNFAGRYDGIVINSQVLDTDELVTYTSYNGKKTSHSVARLFVARDDMRDGMVEFTAILAFEPTRDLEIKFRASIIEQHKEIDSIILFGKVSA